MDLEKIIAATAAIQSPYDSWTEKDSAHDHTKIIVELSFDELNSLERALSAFLEKNPYAYDYAELKSMYKLAEGLELIKQQASDLFDEKVKEKREELEKEIESS